MPTLQTTTRLAMTAAMPLAVAVIVSGLAGCRGDREDQPPRQFFPDLDDQPKWKPQTKSDFFADGRTMRPEVTGAIAYSRVAFDPSSLDMNTPAEDRPKWSMKYLKERDDFLAEDRAFYTGKAADDTFLPRIPVAFDRAVVERGRLKYDIYCSACHSTVGDGNGMVGQQWSYPLPNFHDDKYKKPDPGNPAGIQHLDGYLFHTIRNGIPDTAKLGEYKMPAYGHAINESDAWAVVAYIRALQASRDAAAADLPPGKAEELEKLRRPNAAAPAGAATTGGKP